MKCFCFIQLLLSKNLHEASAKISIIIKMKEFFEDKLSTFKRPTSARCRQFLIKRNISNKTDKQVQDKVHTLGLAKKRSKVSTLCYFKRRQLSDKLADLVPSYLLAALIDTNSQRPGAVLNFDMNDYHKQKEVEKDGETLTLIKVIATI